MHPFRPRLALPTLAIRLGLLAFVGCEPDSSPVLTPALAESTDPAAEAAVPHPQGLWTTLPDRMDINPIHAVLLTSPISRAQREQLGGHIGKVLVVSGSGDYWAATDFLSEVHDLSTGAVDSHDIYFDAFCSGISVLPNGRPFIVGGTSYSPQLSGLADVAIYDDKTGSYRSRDSMAHGRWYATPTLLPDGRVMVDSGWDENGVMNDTVEIFTPGAGWSPEYPMGWTPMFYVRKHVLPDGRVFASGPENESRMFDPAIASELVTGWSHVDWTNYGGAPNQYNREYGTSVLLGLHPEDGYRPTVMIMGGNRANPTNTTELIDLGAASPAWRWGPAMSGPRVRMNAVILPDETVLALGGSSVDYDPAHATLAADLYDPSTNAFSPASTMAYPRLDHSVALLLPDATVWVAGSQQTIPDYEDHVEVYQPAYLFNPDGTLATRPVIDHAPHRASYGQAFTVNSTEAAGIASVVLVRPGAVTHSFNTDQRLVALDFTAAAGVLTVTPPPDANVAPPGYYMLFLVDQAGIPSVATFVLLR
jgi:hypothetical protein